MVGIVLVSHSRPLATAARDVVLAMAGKDLPVAVAAGAGENHSELGTDAMEILEAINSVMSDEGVLVIMDMGSAVLSTETALDFLEEERRGKVKLSAAPIVEGAVAAGIAANVGSSLEDTAREAMRALQQKMEHLPSGEPEAAAASPRPASGQQDQRPASSITLVVTNEHGLHARPAARFIKECGRFEADITVENVTKGKGPVSAKSFGAIASLEILRGNEIRINARGPESEKALEALKLLAGARFGDAEAAPAPAKAEVPAMRMSAAWGPTAQPIAEGIALGTAKLARNVRPEIPTNTIDNPEEEWKKMRNALEAARSGLLKEAKSIGSRAGEETAGIFEAQALLLEDPELLEGVKRRISDEKLNAARAWELGFQQLAEQYKNLRDEYQRQRAADVADAGWRVIAELGIATGHALETSGENILVADDLAPAEVSKLGSGNVAGVILLDGGPTSHSAILLRTLGIPSVAQARPLFSGREIPESATLALNGATGEVWIDPGPEKVRELERERSAFEQTRAREIKAAHQPAATRDGHRVEIFANVTTADEARAALKAGGEGVGLLRTEFLFLHRDSAPGEDEQIAALKPVIDAMEGHAVVIRTLDAGGDKELGYLGLKREANPFLGVRALRVSLRNPQLFNTQLRALLRAGRDRDLRIMFPMVSEKEELRRAMRALQSVHESLENEGVPHAWPVQTGIMVEVPSAALMAGSLAEDCSFFSIGTNDLTQYTLAADRGNPDLPEFQDALHPAVLQLVRRIVEAAHRHGRTAAVCGEAAGDVQGALVFAGLGIDELSMTPPAIPKIKAAIRESDFAELQRLCDKLLEMESAAEVRRAVTDFLSRPHA